jgi:hypothetical protein
LCSWALFDGQDDSISGHAVKYAGQAGVLSNPESRTVMNFGVAYLTGAPGARLEWWPQDALTP